MERFVFYIMEQDEIEREVERMTTGEHAFDKKTALRILRMFDNALYLAKKKEKDERMLKELLASFGF